MSEYKKSGVDLDSVKDIHKTIADMLSKTYRNTVIGAGHYAGVIDLDGKKIALHVDGVGTKTLLALKTGIIEPTGIDCVAMNVNDIACVGARPVALLDYLAMEKEDKTTITEVLKGIIKGSEEAHVEVVGGETAIMPSVVNGFDVSCSVMGKVERLITGSDIVPGDIVIGLPSNGIHSNGFSLVRRLIDQGKISLKDYAEEIMKPTAIYSDAVLEVLPKIHGAAHITGGAFTKLHRVTNHGIEIQMPDPPEIFKVIENSGVPHDEMYKVFNMGVGMVIFVSEEYGEDVKRELAKKNFNAIELGRVTNSHSEVRITTHKGSVLHL
ncbi:Phosphoribosylformylglycinamidine cyclo-ligase [Sulfuracidifex tepidarius]|uniref:Phosphoribosylformylglycinamidine cyclo-ligase n=1 Tax=Sulfuracidifex tepidarius TaxID=1294262 RepID=A0A510E2T6_9CREN|nr:Phosphoribosylformylglycinamidine cyclo-ligase [Sulfuracidifex tepidarius]BBG26809.1 Phosphoribosylformylglycinamidine cyclo-ligase [Sulfuracidifex tepidarius]